MKADWFRRLVQALDYGTGFELFFLVGPGQRGKELLGRLAKALARFGEPRWHALDQHGIDTLLGDVEPGVLHLVAGLEHTTRPQARDLLARLNLNRDRLQELAAPVLFWVPEDLYDELLAQAVDLFAWRSQVDIVSLSDLESEDAPSDTQAEDPSAHGVLVEHPQALEHQLRRGQPLTIGDVLGKRYRLVQRAGAGGFATVWKAYDLETHAFVAIKVLHEQWAMDRSRVERFERGARRMAALDHPAVVRVLALVVNDEGHHFFAMPWQHGGDLYRAVRGGTIERDTALLACARAIEGLSYAHAHGLLHLDMKPSNILLDDDQHGALTDFDLVMAADTTASTRTNGGLGSFFYAAPEQLREAAPVDARADVYGAAMCVLFVLIGKDPPPLPAATEPALFDQLKCSEALRQALRGALAYPRDDRRTTLEQLISAIRDDHARAGPGRSSWHAEAEDEHGRWASFRVGAVEQRMRWIEPGSFIMGSPPDEPGRFEKEGPQHQVTISRGFWLAETPCTNALWAEVMNAESGPDDAPEHAVRDVSWDDVQRFTVSLQDRLGGSRFGLATEAEWEYACRAGTSTATYAGADRPDEIAWFWQNSDGQPRAVGTKRCNAWGLYDMLGLVWEWTADGPRTYDGHPVVDPLGPPGPYRVRRGGSWGSDVRFARAACRDWYEPSYAYGSVGFRLLRHG